jgi:hypothetical protein
MTAEIISSILQSLPTSPRAAVEVDTDVPIHLRAKLSRQTQMAMAKAAKKAASRKLLDEGTAKRHADRRKRVASFRQINKAIYRKYQRFLHDSDRRGMKVSMSLDDFIHLWQVIPPVCVKGVLVPAIDLRRPMTVYPRVSLRQIDADKPYALGNIKVMLYEGRYLPATCIYPDSEATGIAIVKQRRKKPRRRPTPSKAKVLARINAIDFNKYKQVAKHRS